MESNNRNYNFDSSLNRIDGFINQSDTSYEEVNSIPTRNELTYDNGYYVNCSAIFIDIRESSDLTDNHYRPTLAKLYRAFISETIALLNSNRYCKEIFINGDCVTGICNTFGSTSADELIDTVAKICSLVDILNCKFRKSDIEEIDVGIGISYGRALMIQAGYKGSGLYEVVWMGDVVNEASNLCNKANKESDSRVLISNSFLLRLSEDYQEKFTENWMFAFLGDIEANLKDEEMESWYKENCTSALLSRILRDFEI